MLEFLLSTDAILALLTLTFLEIILGIDNIVFDGLTIRGAYNDADLGGALFCSFDIEKENCKWRLL